MYSTRNYRPLLENQRGPPQRSSAQSAPQIRALWKSWESVAVNLSNVPKEANTLCLWKAFRDQGNILSIDIFEDSHGNRASRAKIRFRPPPSTAFWKRGNWQIILPNGRSSSVLLSLDNKPPEWTIQSSVRPDVSYPAEIDIPISSMDIGILVNDTTMRPMRTVGSGLNENTSLVLNLRRKDMLVYFQISTHGAPNILVFHEYRLRVPFSQLDRFFQSKNPSTGVISHFTVLESPPIYHRRIKNIETTFIEESTWRESDTWFRQTHIVHNPQTLVTLPVNLRRQDQIIDIGRWNALRINFPAKCDERGKFSLLCDALSDHNLVVEQTDRFTLCDGTKKAPLPIWKWIDVPDSNGPGTSYSSLQDLIDPAHIHLPFAVRYQLEVCLSHGYLSEFNMSREFALNLAELGEKEATRLLEHVAMQKKIYYNPMDIFKLEFTKGITDRRIPPYCCYMRSARITPSTIYYNVPSVDISNRVIRHYIDLADNFLRVRFTDEKQLGRIYSTADNTMDEVFTRIKRALANGIVIGNTKYEFLAFGNSQFREHGAYFFAPKDGVTAATQIAMSELKVKTPSREPPSAFQFRLGGCKGMLIVSPEASRQEVHIRRSQYKFSARHSGLEIIRWSQFSIATLNRQLILVLSTLGIPDEAFHLKLRSMLRNLDEAIESDSKAINLLKTYVDPNQMTLTVSQMIFDGFRRSKEPFITSVFNLWRVWHLKYLKEKAKIAIEKGACLLGCMDETATLKGYFSDKIPKRDAPFEETLAALPEIFVQVSHPGNGGQYEIIEGLCILARNPSLHPGDIRVVRAVNVPQLSHLKDVVVLPQTGDRDVASMCSGGDLDGDDYLVVWDQDLLPNDWFREPMMYTSRKAHDLDHDVTVDEITSFFVTYIKNDCLPTIAHAHLAWGDSLDDGVDEAKCIQLAQLHSDAVDYNKTGNPAVMTRNLRPRRWPHFMEKTNMPAHMVYRSGKILGQLYDAVERVDFVPSTEMCFDRRILDCDIEINEVICNLAKGLKAEYDTAMRRIMAQHDIKTEFEVWSTFVLSHSKLNKDYKFHEEIGAISAALQEEFRKKIYEEIGGRSFELLAPMAVAMYRITHEETVAALEKHRRTAVPDENSLPTSAPKIEQKMPLISFPWIFPQTLGQIATGHYEQLAPEMPALNQRGRDTPIPTITTKDESNALETGTTQTTPETKAVTDPFGLNIGDQSVTTASIEKSTRLAGSRHNQQNLQLSSSNNSSRDINSLEQLLDFGLSSLPNAAASSLIFSGAPANKETSLLDFDVVTDSARWLIAPGEGGETPKESQLVQDQESNPNCIEIIDEGTCEPTALDTLNELLGL
ncbi:hypothetical protein ARAM_000426 [Aspergillus rambellii]|uniref:RNA-dependent RNA polymerase n=1 Tax=Aspergillus rambellii TaxID=308745 RepID=A0A0F8WYS9_9EURO|nr:hypothetical protein ARAM_000426 [Aspergillus rambellii]